MWSKSFVIMILFVFLILPVDGFADKPNHKQVVLLIVPSLSFQEVEELLAKESIWHEAAVGAMNVRPDGPYSYLNNMVTLASGVKARGVQGWNSFESDEYINEIEITEWMKQVTGGVPAGSLLHPDLHRLVHTNEQTTHRGQIGRFGSILEQAGVIREVYGHSDTNSEKARYGSLVVLNEEGLVSGYLNAAVQKRSGAPYGVEMNTEYLINKLSTPMENDRLVVIEWGDFYRLYDQGPFIDPIWFQKERKRQLERLTSFVQKVHKETPQEVWLVAPMMHKEAYQAKEQLAPVFYFGEDRGGFLTSSTTRQDQLVSSLDLIPTLLASFNIPTSGWQGNQIVQVDTHHVDKSDLLKKVDEIVLIYKSRASVLSIYISCLVVALLAATLFSLLKTMQKRTFLTVVRFTLLSALWSPFWFLVLSPLIKTIGVSGFVLALIGGSFLCGYVVEKTSPSPTFWIGFITFLFITVDLFYGTPFMQRSYLGYDPIIGARYYGIGNEYAGIYIISAFMMITPFLKKRRDKWISSAIIGMCIFLFVVLGKSTLGTNAGATLSAGIGFAFLFYRYLQIELNWRRMIVLGVLVTGAIVLLLYLVQLSGEKTHIGVAFERLLDGDFAYIVNTIERKMAMNMKIFRHSNWTQLFVTSYVLVAIILWRKHLQLEDRGMRLFLQAGVVTSFALLLLNDSGVVAAATSMFSVVSVHYYQLSFSKEENKEKELTVTEEWWG